MSEGITLNNQLGSLNTHLFCCYWVTKPLSYMNQSRNDYIGKKKQIYQVEECPLMSTQNQCMWPYLGRRDFEITIKLRREHVHNNESEIQRLATLSGRRHVTCDTGGREGATELEPRNTNNCGQPPEVGRRPGKSLPCSNTNFRTVTGQAAVFGHLQPWK